MAVDKRTSGGSGAPADDETPDWTTWLRSRLERVVTPDRKGPETGGGDPSGEAVVPAPSSTDAGRAGPGTDAAMARLSEKVEALADATAACRALIEEQAATGERLAAWVQELATVQADDERWALAVGRVVDAADAERRGADERAGAALATLSSRVERIEERLGGISSELAGLRRDVTRPARSTVRLGEPQLQAVAARIAAAMAGPGTTAQPGRGRGRGAAGDDDGGAEPQKARPRRATSLRAAPPGPSSRRAR